MQLYIHDFLFFIISVDRILDVRDLVTCFSSILPDIESFNIFGYLTENIIIPVCLFCWGYIYIMTNISGGMSERTL